MPIYVTCAGTSAANGVYYTDGVGGYTNKNDSNYVLNTSGNYWRIVGPGSSVLYQLYQAVLGDPIDATSWTVVNGASPAPKTYDYVYNQFPFLQLSVTGSNISNVDGTYIWDGTRATYVNVATTHEIVYNGGDWYLFPYPYTSNNAIYNFTGNDIIGSVNDPPLGTWQTTIYAPGGATSISTTLAGQGATLCGGGGDPINSGLYVYQNNNIFYLRGSNNTFYIRKT